MKLKNWVPQEFHTQYMDTYAAKLLECEVIQDYTSGDIGFFTNIFTHKHIYNWCIVTNGEKKWAVGWNENPSRGWSFPVKRIYNV